MNRYRVVTRTTNETGSETHVSSVVQSLGEALADLDIEERMASNAGWDTVRLDAARIRIFGGVSPQLVCRRGRTSRSITIRESDPFNDQIT